MNYDFQNIKHEFGLSSEVYLPIKLLQPTQIGLCNMRLKKVKNGQPTLPVIVWPIDYGKRYAILDGTHTTFLTDKAGANKIPTQLFLRLDEKVMEIYDKLGLVEEKKSVKLQYKDELRKLDITDLMSRIKFVRTEFGIYTISDLGSNVIINGKDDLINLNEKNYDSWLKSQV